MTFWPPGIEQRLPADRAQQRIIAWCGGRDQVGEQEPQPRLIAPAQPGPGQQDLGRLARRQVRLHGAPEEGIAFPGRVGEAAVARTGCDRGPPGRDPAEFGAQPAGPPAG
jgi:hypothetical protein